MQNMPVANSSAAAVTESSTPPAPEFPLRRLYFVARVPKDSFYPVKFVTIPPKLARIKLVGFSLACIFERVDIYRIYLWKKKMAINILFRKSVRAMRAKLTNIPRFTKI